MTEAAEAQKETKMGRPPKLHPVKLLKNHAPMKNRYEIGGYWTKEFYRNKPDGEGKELVPAKFIEGEEAPPPYPGVGTLTKKIWAGTIVKFEADHANYLVRNKLAERVDEFE